MLVCEYNFIRLNMFLFILFKFKFICFKLNNLITANCKVREVA